MRGRGATAVRPFLARPLVLSIAAGVRASDAGALARLGRHRAHDAEHARADRRRHHRHAGAGWRQRGAARSLQDRSCAPVGAGHVVRRRESLLDPVTAISGSGPAYVFYFIEAMQQAAHDLGFDAAQARALAVADVRRRGATGADLARARVGAARARHFEGRHDRRCAREPGSATRCGRAIVKALQRRERARAGTRRRARPLARWCAAVVERRYPRQTSPARRSCTTMKLSGPVRCSRTAALVPCPPRRGQDRGRAAVCRVHVG